MLTRKPTLATQAGRTPAATLCLLLCVSAHATPAAGTDSTDALPAGAALYGVFRDARASVPDSAQRTVSFKDIRRPAVDSAHVSVEGEAAHAGVLAEPRRAFGRNLPLPDDRASQGEPEFLLRNPDAFVRTKIELTLGRKWPGFAYADVGAADSALRWQGLAGIRAGHGFDMLGGWRHITYHFRSGMGLDSLDFNGPFLGATLAW